MSVAGVIHYHHNHHLHQVLGREETACYRQPITQYLNDEFEQINVVIKR